MAAAARIEQGGVGVMAAECSGIEALPVRVGDRSAHHDDRDGILVHVGVPGDAIALQAGPGTNAREEFGRDWNGDRSRVVLQ